MANDSMCGVMSTCISNDILNMANARSWQHAISLFGGARQLAYMAAAYPAAGVAAAARWRSAAKLRRKPAGWLSWQRSMPAES
jgi:hypothetical protein